MSRPLRLLHLEDDARDAELIRSRLEGDGFTCEVIWVSGGAEFESAIDGGHFDLVLSDLDLPGYDGMAALKYVQSRHPGVPLIFISGRSPLDESLLAEVTVVPKQSLQMLAGAIRRHIAAVD